MESITLVTKTENKLLNILTSKPKGYLFSQEELADGLYGSSDVYSKKAIRTYICRLRKILGRNVITTVNGFGYILSAIEVCKECNGTGYKTIN